MAAGKITKEELAGGAAEALELALAMLDGRSPADAEITPATGRAALCLVVTLALHNAHLNGAVSEAAAAARARRALKGILGHSRTLAASCGDHAAR